LVQAKLALRPPMRGGLEGALPDAGVYSPRSPFVRVANKGLQVLYFGRVANKGLSAAKLARVANTGLRRSEIHYGNLNRPRVSQS